MSDINQELTNLRAMFRLNMMFEKCPGCGNRRPLEIAEEGGESYPLQYCGTCREEFLVSLAEDRERRRAS